MNAPLLWSEWRNATGLARRGWRTPATRLAIDETRIILHRVRQEHFADIKSDRKAAEMLHNRWTSYQALQWRRTRIEVNCPHPPGKIEVALWLLLRVRDRVLGEEAIRKIFRTPGFNTQSARHAPSKSTTGEMTMADAFPEVVTPSAPLELFGFTSLADPVDILAASPDTAPHCNQRYCEGRKRCRGGATAGLQNICRRDFQLCHSGDT